MISTLMITSPLIATESVGTIVGRTEIRAASVDGRQTAHWRSGLIRAQQVRSPRGWTKIGLIASTALLLGGDRVELSVDVGPGARLWLFEVAGTVAYHGRGRSAAWQVEARVAAGGSLIMVGEPFVVSAGAEVDRSFSLNVVESGSALVRETVVLGRSGEIGGALRNRTMISRGGVDVSVEDQHLDVRTRSLPGILGAHRVMDTVTVIGTGVTVPAPAGAAAFALPDAAGTVLRWIGTESAASTLHAGWPQLIEQAQLPTR